MPEAPEQLKKLTIDQLRKLHPNIPKRLKKKGEIIEWISSHTSTSSQPVVTSIPQSPFTSSHVMSQPGHNSPISIDVSSPVFGGNVDGEPKRPKVSIAPVFLKSVSSQSVPSCRLCAGAGTLWSELGLAVCPVCTTASRCPSPSPSVKHEQGVTSLAYDFDANGNIQLKLGKIDTDQLCDLVLVYGFGVCESIEALHECGSGDILKSAEWLTQRHRRSAEDASVTEAQLNSELVRESTKEDKRTNQLRAREAVVGDISVLLDVDAEFCSDHVFNDSRDTNKLAEWMMTAEPNILLVFDYLVLKRDSIKWYKRDAIAYFEKIERLNGFGGADGMADWFRGQIEAITEAVYNIPQTGGAIPALFRSATTPAQEPSDDADDDVEVVECTHHGGEQAVSSLTVVQLE